MKHIYLSFLFVITFSAVFAQPSFTSADLPGIGDRDTVMYLNYYPITNNLDSETGNGYNWDFSSLPFSMYPGFKYIDTWRVKTHQVSQSFPDATIEEFIDDGTAGDVNLYSFGNDTLYIYRLGSVLNGSSFIPPITSVAFPVSFNTSSVLTYYFHTAQYLTGERTTTFSYDGFGTLQMPGNKTFSNVLRVKQTEKDSSYITHTANTYISYIWYKQGGQVPILRLAYSGSLNLYFAFGSKANGTPNAIEEPGESVDFTLFPNPSDGKFRLAGLTFTPDKTEVSNFLGEKIGTASADGTIDLSGSARGTYFVTVFKGTRSYTRKAFIR
jgi:hypothetical protein